MFNIAQQTIKKQLHINI